MPASPRGSLEDLDDFDAMESKRAEQSNSFKDPSVVGACPDESLVRAV